MFLTREIPQGWENVWVRKETRKVVRTPTISPQVLNTPQRRLPIRHRRIQIMLLPVVIHTEPLKRQIPPGPKMRLHRPRQKQRALHRQRLHPVLHHAQLQRDDACDLNGAAEGDLAVALAEMQVPDAELGALDVDGEVHLAAAREVLDVAVAAVFRAAGHRACAFSADLVLDLFGRAAGVDVLGLWGEGDLAAGVLAEGGDKLGFAAVPFCEDGGGGGAAEDAWMNVAWEADMRYVTGGAEDAFEVPDGFCAMGQGWGVNLSGQEGGRHYHIGVSAQRLHRSGPQRVRKMLTH